ncbi:hypothetical protein BpHYR1_012407 [Brachionus plicatilis]|uniref:Uncharacterized protein n=1 Tax=Brachionus plicatilis TaxID=10195 RepID=A0A3M7SHX6_BRAPC|nr:hypothetical protein BpHYR1_012407 [Brachionus plicatilis]
MFCKKFLIKEMINLDSQKIILANLLNAIELKHLFKKKKLLSSHYRSIKNIRPESVNSFKTNMDKLCLGYKSSSFTVTKGVSP